MKWTAKDTAYGLSVIIFLGSWGYSIHAIEQRRQAERYSDLPEVTPELQQYADENGLQLVPGNGEWILYGGEATEKQIETPAPIIGRVKTVDIDRNAAPEEIARKLGIKVENLPPSLMKRPDATDDPQSTESEYE